MADQSYLIELVLRARNEMASVLASAKAEVRAFADETSATTARASEDAVRSERAHTEAAMSGARERARAAGTGAAATKKATEATKDQARATVDLTQKANRLLNIQGRVDRQVREGRRSADDAVKAYQRLASAFDRLVSHTGIGSSRERDMARLAAAARGMAQEMSREQGRSARESKDFWKVLFGELTDEFSRQERVQSDIHRSEEQDRLRVTKARMDAEVEAARRARAEEAEAERRRDASRNRDVRARAAYGAGEELNRQLPTLDRDTAAYRLRDHIGELRSLSSAYERGSEEAEYFGRAAETAARQLKSLDRGTNDTDGRMRSFLRTAENVSRELQHAGVNMASIGVQIRGVIVVGAISFFQQLATTAIGLGGNLVALSGSATVAGGALGGALAAGALQAVPALGLLASAISSVGNVMDAVKQAQNAQQQAATQAGTSADQQRNKTNALANAQDGLVAANERVADANRAVRDAQRGITDARADAVRQLQDLVNAERDAELQARGAVLSQEDAQRRLRQAMQSGDTQEIARARLGVDEAAQGRLTADQNVARAGEDLREFRRGPEGLADARERLADARRGLVAAERDADRAGRAVREAGRDAQDAAAKTVTAQRNLDYLLSQMSTGERALYESVTRIQRRYRALIVPITDVILQSFATTVDRISALMGDDRVLGMLRHYADEIADSIDRVSRYFTRSRIVDILVSIGNQGANNLRRITDGFIAFGDAVLRIADAAGPSFARMVDDIAAFFERFDALVSRNYSDGDLGRFFEEGRVALGEWLGLIGDIGSLFWTISSDGGGAASGLRIVERWRAAIQGLRDDIERDPSGTRGFFRDSEEILHQVARVLAAVGRELRKSFDPEAVEAIADMLIRVLIPALGDVIRIVGDAVQAFERLTDNEVVATISKMLIVFVALRKILFVFGGLGGGLLGGLVAGLNRTDRFARGAAGAIGGLGSAFRGLGAAMLAFSKGAGIKGAISAFGGVTKSAREARRVASQPMRVPPMLTMGPGGAIGRGPNTGAPAGYTQTPGGVFVPSGGGPRAGSSTGGRFSRFRTGFGNLRAGGLRGLPGALGSGIAGIGTRATSAVGAGIGTALTASGGSLLAAGAAGGGALLRGAGRLGLNALRGAGKAFLPVTAALGLFDFATASGGVGNRAKSALSGATFGLSNKVGFLRTDEKEAEGRAKKFVDAYESQFKRMSSKGDIAGLARLREQAAKLAKDSPEYADRLREMAQGTEEYERALRKTTGELARYGVSASDVAKKGIDLSEITSPYKFALVQDNFDRMRSGAIKSLSGISRSMRQNFSDINETAAEGSQTWQRLVTDNFGEGIRAIRRGMRSGRISTEDGMRAIGKITKQQMQFARDNMDTLSAEAKTRLAGNLDAAVTATINKMGGIENATKDTLRKIRKMMEQSLQLYGLSPKQARTLARNRTTPGRENLDQWNRRDEGTTGMGNAGGGWIGNRGERGADDERNLRASDGKPTGRGEAILNWGHQRIVEPALRAQYGFGLDDVFRRTKGLHAGHARSSEGHAGGGIVGIPGMPGESIFKPILPAVQQLIRRFKVRVTDGYAASGHATNSDHKWGGAVDLVPGAGGSWDLIDRLARLAEPTQNHPVPPFRWVGYTGDSGHGRGNHLHLSWTRGKYGLPGSVTTGRLPAGGSGGGASGVNNAVTQMAKRVSAQAAKVAGADQAGPLGEIAKAAAAQARMAANSVIDSVNEQMGGSQGGPLDSGVTSADGGVARTILRVWRGLRSPRKHLLAAFETGLVESGMRNLSGGDADSAGWRQERASLYKNPTNVVAAAERFFQEARQLDRGQSAGALAADVQRPREDLRGKYALRREDAVALLKRLGVRGFWQGGPVTGPGTGTSDSIVGRLSAGEHVWTAAEVAKAGGHRVIYALRSMLGGGDQAPGSDFARGGTPAMQVGRLVGESYPGSDATLRLGPGELAPIADLMKSVDKLTEAAREAGVEVKLTREQTRAREQWRRTSGRVDYLTPEQERRRNIRRTGTYALPTFDALNVDDLVAEIQRVNRAIRVARRKGKKDFEGATEKITKSLTALTQDSGLLSQMTDALDRTRARRQRILARRTYRQNPDGSVSRLLSDDQVAGATATIAAVDQADTTRVRDAAQATYDLAGRRMGNIDRRLRRLRRGRENAQQRAQIDALVEQRGTLKGQRRQIRDTIADLNDQIQEAIAARYQAQVDAFNSDLERSDAASSRRQSYLERGQKFLSFGNVGAAVALGGQRTADDFFVRQREEYGRQITEATRLQQEALRLGFADKAEELGDKIVDLTIQVEENTIAQKEAAAARAMEAYNRTSGFYGQGISLVTAMSNGGQLPVGVLRNFYTTVINSAREALAQSVPQLVADLGLPAGTNWDFSTPEGVQAFLDQVTPLISAAPDALKPVLETLVNNILTANSAIVENTNQMKDLNGNLSLQTFSTTAWSQYRTAIFDGMNGLLPEYAVRPDMMTGAPVVNTPVPAPSSGSTEANITLNVEKPIEEADPMSIAKRTAWEFKTIT